MTSMRSCARKERRGQVFRGFEAAEAADDAYYAGLTPQARVAILLELIAAYQESIGEAQPRLERVCRVTQLTAA
ncbi:MAG: hypothetical protein IPL61_16655 [Myxococcales bacterium]|nr:hypothetical protein [Myxococcales bacterium]